MWLESMHTKNAPHRTIDRRDQGCSLLSASSFSRCDKRFTCTRRGHCAAPQLLSSSTWSVFYAVIFCPPHCKRSAECEKQKERKKNCALRRQTLQSMHWTLLRPRRCDHKLVGAHFWLSASMNACRRAQHHQNKIVRRENVQGSKQQAKKRRVIIMEPH